jgi:hypothetical protein
MIPQRVSEVIPYTLDLTPALDGGGVQRQAPAALPPRKNRYPLYKMLGGPQSRVV